ncbi:MAG: hypothetical protein K2M99_05910 [Treponemataceae bacterium]|nr:hypothetical protein [Treponemataceae bacterium]
MKKLFLPIVFLCLLVGCESGKSGPFYVVNNTEDELHIIVSAKTYTDVSYTIKADEEFDTGIDYYTPTVKIVKDFESKIESNKYEARRNGFYTHIFEIQETRFSVLNNIPADVFEGTDTLYFYEKDGKADEWAGENTKKKIEASESVTVSCFTKSPQFILESTSDSGETTVGKCNGYSVTVRIEGGIIYLE